jgi:hypothetical protein
MYQSLPIDYYTHSWCAGIYNYLAEIGFHSSPLKFEETLRKRYRRIFFERENEGKSL